MPKPNKVKALLKPAPLEHTFDRILTPFEDYIHQESTGGILLMFATLVALAIANSPLYDAYQHLLHTHFSLQWNSSTIIDMSLHHWINDGLMALFFFVVGLEIKREALVGELADIRQAVLPVIAAVGGMIVPALIFVGFNWGTDTAHGWGIPMATDIAFAVGLLTLLGSRVPTALMSFLVALAIVDDLGAVAVIALFYSDSINLGAFGIVALLFGLLWMFNLGGIRKIWPYFVIGIGLWFAMHASGVHATLAGILVAWTIPTRSRYQPNEFSRLINQLMGRFHQTLEDRHDLLWKENQRRAMLRTLVKGVRMMETPLQSLEHTLHLPVAFIIVPLFALANAGIPIAVEQIDQVLEHSVALGIIFGLVIGKFIGVGIVSLLAVKLGIAQLPNGVSTAQILGVGLLAGVGFTMSIFIAELGFAGNEELLLIAKTGVLAASLIAGAGGFIWLWLVSKPADNDSETSKNAH